MKRALEALGSSFYDVVVIGGGIYGACIARDAALRGLRVALLERGDFGHATSHNSLKLIHGGLRYLQHLDLRRVRDSIRERTRWLKSAPHLIRPLEFIIPTYGHGARGREALWSAAQLYNVLAADRNRGLAPEQYLPSARVVSRAECRRRIAGINHAGVTGGCLWYDGQMQNADRVVLECVEDAVEAGTDAANYVEARGLIIEKAQVKGVRLHDLLSDTALEIRARLVVNAGGPWLAKVLGPGLVARYRHPLLLSRALNLVTRPLVRRYAVGVSSHRASDAVVGHSKRLYFITPWRGLNVIGTTHLPFDDDPDAYRITRSEVETFIDEINRAYPPAELTREDVVYCYGGLTPAAEGLDGNEIRRARRSLVIDHSQEDGVGGLLTVCGAKFTTARAVSEQVVDAAERKLGRRPTACATREKVFPGARDYPGRAALRENMQQRLGGALDDAALESLEDYGTRYERMLRLGSWNGQASEQSIFQARCRYAVREEMAQSLADLVFRRTDLAARGLLTEHALRWCASMMMSELQWAGLKSVEELGKVRAHLAEVGAPRLWAKTNRPVRPARSA